MKILLRTLIACALIPGTLLFTSCEKDESTTSTAGFSAENSIIAAKTDNTVEGTLTILEHGYDEQVSGRSANIVSLFTDCTTITLNENGDGTGTVVFDFGEGCTLRNGATVSGIINLEYQAIVNDSRTIMYDFQDFTYNDNGVVGGGRIVRKLTNANGNPESMINETITVSFPNSDITATREGERIAEWVEGVGSGTWSDNVYHINGGWTTTFTNGFERTGEVTKTLVRRLSCIYLVEGILEVTQDGLTGSLDFGEGACDNVAIFTINGSQYTVNL